jgi:hypothetical protein
MSLLFDGMTLKGDIERSGAKLVPVFSAFHKSHMNWLALNAGFRFQKLETNCLGHVSARMSCLVHK